MINKNKQKDLKNTIKVLSFMKKRVDKGHKLIEVGYGLHPVVCNRIYNSFNMIQTELNKLGWVIYESWDNEFAYVIKYIGDKNAQD